MSLPGAPASGHGELGFTAVDSAGRSVGAGWRNRPALPVLGLCQREGVPLGRVSSAACRVRAAFSLSSEASKQPRHDSRHRGRDPGLATSDRALVHALAGQRKLFSRACPRRPKRAQPHSLAGASGSGRGCAPVGLFPRLWAGPGSTRRSVGAQVLTFGMSSQRVV